MNRETSFSSSDTLVVVDRSTRRRNIIIAAVVGIAVLLAAFLIFGRGGDEKAAGAAGAGPGGGQVPTVTVVVPGRTQVARAIAATGSLAARVDMPVGVAGEGGMVASVLVQPGQWVGAGQTLAVIDRAVQARQTQQLAAQVQVARADAALAQNEFERSESLVGRGFVSKADLDRKRAARDAATARVRVSEASLAESRARMGRLDIRSPAAGLVLERNVEPGQVVSPGSGALFRVARGGEMELKAQLSEADLVTLKVGAPASVTPVGSAQSYAGSVWQISPVVNMQNRQGVARIALPYNETLRPGGFASVSIVAGSQEAPVLPESAIQSDDKGNFVYVVSKANRAERRPVKTGTVTPAGIAVVEGLSGNEMVVLRAGGFLNPGDRVRPQRQKN
ncbi:efflux RND transporter periplasmic adaptor subunit [Sphingomonas sp. NSE70-1]|uniref:Efflux RND transporter periplasmic adaptor subunit n=1 Tax=Sphingomonas caseinilyticus TaxID=2908205 RepID=A0ABT0RTU9_9SPHN|nr:efflux RND transporter periplasmic adaptor subunit [Sphingomonas caseinilyticus]MCL6698425.1 efflux RND transporter periplasmic adaptor subunit [Sphingomonas caseinilyticus]